MRNKKTIKEFRAFYIMASSVYAKSSRKRKWGVRDCKAVHASFKIRNSIGYSKN